MQCLETPVKTEMASIKEETLKMSPEAKAMSAQANGLSANSSRRPPRKSTLTQQQKNQKRQRATQDQLSTLEIEFEKNPTPTAAVRETIAQEINMTERSVQIWFQNRRAKIKNMAKKSIETGEDCDAIPESMRKYLAMQALESGKPLVRDMMGGPGMPSFGGLIMNADSNGSKVLISHLACRSLTIGSWRRISQTALDLVVFYSPAKSMMTYYINAESSGFKIEYPFSIIKNITLDSGNPNAEGSAQIGGLVVELLAPPTFSMDPGSGGWFSCRDFTEDQQASQVMVHHLGGHPKVLSGQLAKLVSLESFRARHHQAAAVQSAPVSPLGINRPASQPNHVVHPHSQVFQEQAFNMGPPAPRGHKRQRSRSVPVAVDFNQLRQPMQPFMMHHDIPPHIIHHHHIFAPVPHSMPQTPHTFLPPNADAANAGYFAPPPHQQQQQQQQQQPPAPPGLTIDTSHAQDFGVDFNKQMPQSATTANSSSEFEPNFYTAGPQSDTFSATHLNTPYQSQFLSPMVDPSTVGTQPASPFHSASPLSTVSHHGDPVIANQSPPLGGYDGSNANDVFTLTPNEEGFTEDSFNFNEMFSKQPIQLPFRSPMESAQEEFDFQSMIHFGGGDTSSLSPEHVESFNSNA